MIRKLSFVAIGLVAAAARGQLTIPGADGSDGAFAPVANTVVDLGLAATATWDTPSPVSGNGVYDGDKWAVVFKYTSVNIPTGVTVTFTNHPKRAPVVWLVQGNVTVGGTINLKGANGTGVAGTHSEPGPGGFRGGRAKLVVSSAGSGGFGAGGADYDEEPNNMGGGGYGSMGASYNPSPNVGGRSYGHDQILPLIGGSGGGAGSFETGGNLDDSGGAGGGAILMASGGTITIDGSVNADGGSVAPEGGGGSGGAIRIVSATLSGSGSLFARGGTGITSGGTGHGGNGRIRVESVGMVNAVPSASGTTPDDPPLLWPAAGTMTLRATHFTIIDAEGMPQMVPIPGDPSASLAIPADASIETSAPVTLHVEATNVPLNWIITARIVPVTGETMEPTATLDGGSTQALSHWTISNLNLPGGFAGIALRGDAPP